MSSFKSTPEQLPPDLVEFESVDRRFTPASFDSAKSAIVNDSGAKVSSSRNNTFNEDVMGMHGTDGTSAVLAASLQALATHCAHLQFRLHQVLAAPTAHRDKLLTELAEFASKPIDLIGDVTAAAEPPLIEGLDDGGSRALLSNSAVPTRMLQHLKTQVSDLERFVSYLQQNEVKSPNNSVSESAAVLNSGNIQNSSRIQSSRRNSDAKLELRNRESDNESDEDPSSVPFHRRIWQSLACGRSRQRVRNADSDGSDFSDTESSASAKLVQKQPSARRRSGSDACDEDTESVIILLETTVRAFLGASESEMESRIEALAYSLAVALTHGIRKERMRSQKSPPNTVHGARPTAIPVAACCWQFLKFIYDSQGGSPSTEASAARLRATFGVPEPVVENARMASSTSDIITLLLGAVNRVTVEEEDEAVSSPRRKSVSVIGTTDSSISAGIRCWARFVRLGLIRSSLVEHNDSGNAGFPLVLWIRAIGTCHRILRATHEKWAPIRSSPDRLIQAVVLLDEMFQQQRSSPNFGRRQRHLDSKARRKLSSQNNNIINVRSQWAAEDVIIPSV